MQNEREGFLDHLLFDKKGDECHSCCVGFFGDLYISRAKFSSKSDNKLQGQKIGDWHLIEIDY